MVWQYLGELWLSGHWRSGPRCLDHVSVHAQIVLFDGFDPLDVIAPFEVLAAGSDAVGGDLVVELVSAEGTAAGDQR